jgi:hypothetical protein
MQEACLTRFDTTILFALTIVTAAAHAEPSCHQTAGAEKARQMVQQCLEVSPATHPPCNASNACPLIEDEIRRGCVMLGKDAPAFCAPFRQGDRVKVFIGR